MSCLDSRILHLFHDQSKNLSNRWRSVSRKNPAPKNNRVRKCARKNRCGWKNFFPTMRGGSDEKLAGKRGVKKSKSARRPEKTRWFFYHFSFFGCFFVKNRTSREGASKKVAILKKHVGHISRTKEPGEDLAHTHRHPGFSTALQFDRDFADRFFADRHHETVRGQSHRLHTQQGFARGRAQHLLLDTQYLHHHFGV